uniref:NADH-ubiquinone oxidoreductase chain 3 n=1 Tax=Concaveplana hamulusa TaxID=3092773 RepID=A0AAF0YZX6_9HEMI|nr:NADH dehydrogenase subunit 3 [Concaveplana hamulusa]WPC85253.1 NADH dehydrogenase subunit 3 [Concaveplana hamulusa]
MNLLLINFLLICFILVIISLMILILGKKSSVDFEKSSPFECGFNPISYKRLPFSIHFFLIAVIFLVFDIEVIIIIPSILTMKFSVVQSWLITLILFIIILMLGLAHEWKNGMLKWAI